MAIELVDITGVVGCKGFTPTSWNYSNESTSPNYTEGVNLFSLAEIGQTITLIDNDYLKIQYTRQNSSSNNLSGWYKSPNGDVSILSISNGWDPSSFFGIVFALDEDNQTGGFFSCLQYNYYGSTKYYIATNSAAQGSNQAYIAIKNSMVSAITSNGGGATHIAKRAGLLSSIGASNLSDILMVSGGGGGGLIIGEDTYAGKDAGGISGNGNNSANQTTGYAFGQGESADGVSGGGGGLYGGSKGVIV